MNREYNLLEEAQPKDHPKEKDTAPIGGGLKRKKKSRLYIIGGSVFLLLLLGGLTVGYMLSSQRAKAGQTPLFSTPSLAGDPSRIKAPGKTEQYASEIQNRKKNLKKEALEADRMDRIAMRWEGIYKPEESLGSNSNAQSRFKGKQAVQVKSQVKSLGEGSSSPRKANVREKPIYKSSSSDNSALHKNKPGDLHKQKILARRAQSERFGEISFNTLEQKKRNLNSPPIARVEAVIDGDQKISQGQYIKFRLTETLTLPGGEVIGANTPLMGLCEFGNSRIKAEVPMVYHKGEPLDIYMKVFDQDLIEGITYNDPRIKQREKEQVDELGYDLYDDIFSEIPYAGGFLAAGRNLARNRSREKSRKVFVTHNYRVVFQVYHRP